LIIQLLYSIVKLSLHRESSIKAGLAHRHIVWKVLQS